MAKYTVLAPSFINNSIANVGDVVEYSGTPGPNLEPLDATGKKAMQAAQGANVADIARQKIAAAGGEPDAVDTAAAATAAAAAAQAVLAGGSAAAVAKAVEKAVEAAPGGAAAGLV